MRSEIYTELSKYRDKSGVYSFRNKTSNKRYIGESICIFSRWKEHSWGHSGAPIFEKAVQTYGFDNFEFTILEECPDEILYEREEYWIDYYKTLDRNFGYNLVKRRDKKGGGMAHTDQSRARIRATLQRRFPDGFSGENNHFFGKTHTEDARKRIGAAAIGNDYAFSRPVVGYSKNGILEFNSGKRASEYFNRDRNTVMRAIKNKYRCGGYFWKFREDYFNGEDHIKDIDSLVRFPGRKKRPVIAYNENEYLEFNSISEANEKLGSNTGKVCRAIKNKQKHRDFYWKYKNNPQIPPQLPEKSL